MDMGGSANDGKQISDGLSHSVGPESDGNVGVGADVANAECLHSSDTELLSEDEIERLYADIGIWASPSDASSAASSARQQTTAPRFEIDLVSPELEECQNGHLEPAQLLLMRQLTNILPISQLRAQQMISEFGTVESAIEHHFSTESTSESSPQKRHVDANHSPGPRNMPTS